MPLNISAGRGQVLAGNSETKRRAEHGPRGDAKDRRQGSLARLYERVDDVLEGGRQVGGALLLALGGQCDDGLAAALLGLHKHHRAQPAGRLALLLDRVLVRVATAGRRLGQQLAGDPVTLQRAQTDGTLRQKSGAHVIQIAEAAERRVIGLDGRGGEEDVEVGVRRVSRDDQLPAVGHRLRLRRGPPSRKLPRVSVQAAAGPERLGGQRRAHARDEAARGQAGHCAGREQRRKEREDRAARGSGQSRRGRAHRGPSPRGLSDVLPRRGRF
eukprot:scaffold5742_cov95-Isochrysis_galbana.AAC.6